MVHLEKNARTGIVYMQLLSHGGHAPHMPHRYPEAPKWNMRPGGLSRVFIRRDATFALPRSVWGMRRLDMAPPPTGATDIGGARMDDRQAGRTGARGSPSFPLWDCYWNPHHNSEVIHTYESPNLHRATEEPVACTLTVSNSFARKVIQLYRTVAEHDLGPHAVDIRKCVRTLVTQGEQAGQGWLVPLFSYQGWKPKCEDRPYRHEGPAGVQVGEPHFTVVLDDSVELLAQLEGVSNVVLQLTGIADAAMDEDEAERPGGAIGEVVWSNNHP